MCLFFKHDFFDIARLDFLISFYKTTLCLDSVGLHLGLNILANLNTWLIVFKQLLAGQKKI